MLPPGKLPPEILMPLLGGLGAGDPRVIAGPTVGEDTAVIDNGDSVLLVTADPITFVADNIGWYAVTVNVNDIAVMGGVPRWFVPVILLPEKTENDAQVRKIFTDIDAACRDYGVTVIGGHTEITPGLDRPVITGNLIGEAAKDEFVDKRSIRPGDSIYLAGGIAVEAVSIIAREKADVIEREFGKDFVQESLNYLHDPGICVLDAARTAAAVRPTGMHDPTEGGLAGGLWELAERSATGFETDVNAVHILPHCSKMCDVLHLNPLQIIASGALLITVEPSAGTALEAAFESAGIPLSRIGVITADTPRRIFRKNREIIPVGQPIVDEIHKIWE